MKIKKSLNLLNLLIIQSNKETKVVGQHTRQHITLERAPESQVKNK